MYSNQKDVVNHHLRTIDLAMQGIEVSVKAVRDRVNLPMLSDDALFIARVQESLIKSGWRFKETTFANGEVVIDVTNSPATFAFDTRSYEFARPYGWGRFQRREAWQKLHDFFLERGLYNQE